MSVVGRVIRAISGVALCAVHPPAVAQSAIAAAATPTHQSRDIAFIQTPAFRPGDPVRRFPLGSRLVRLQYGAGQLTRPVVEILSPGLFAAADPIVSPDGRALLFAGKLLHDTPWQIWEVAIDGGSPRQLTHCLGDCIQPVYLPGDQIAYTSVQGTGASRSSQVEVSSSDGAHAQRITFGPGQYEVEAVLRSGRLLLSAEWPLTGAAGSQRSRTLYVADPDGSGLMLLRQEKPANGVSGSAVELFDGTIVFTHRYGTKAAESTLASIRPGALREVYFHRSANGIASVHALDRQLLIVSRQTEGKRYDLYQLSANGESRGQLLYRDPQASSVQAVSLAQHPAALAYRSILHPDRTSGRMICLDAYASRDFGSERLPGKIARVRALFRTPDGDQVLGEAPVEQDGSFYVTVPANVPFRLQLLGMNGQVLKQQRSWMWVRSGEDRGCVGCHERQALSPENRSPMALQRMDMPASMLGDAASATVTRKAGQP